MEKITNEVADKVRAWFESDEVKAAIAATEKAADNDTGSFEVVITTENLDRYQEVISMAGWELDHYKKNPVVLWGHDHFTLPIGVATDVAIVDGKMVAKGKFAPHEHAQDIRRLYDMGIVRATSVGFIEKEREGNLITRAELLEFSFVSVPANPYALSLAIKSGESIDGLVTRGIFTIKDAEETTETTETEVTLKPEAEPVVEKTFSSKALSPIVDQLRSALGALEALDTEEPERTGEVPEVVDEEAATDALKHYQAQKKLFQSIDTTLGEVLAELRNVSPSR